MRRLAAIAALALPLMAASADAAQRTLTVEIDGPWCDETSYGISLPPRATNIRATPAEGTELIDGAGRHGADVWSVGGDYPGSDYVEWSLGPTCEPRPIVPWLQTFTVRYRVLPIRATLRQGRAASHAKSVLRRRFGAAFRYGYSKGIACSRRISRNARRCRVDWFIGDGIYRGAVRVALFRDRDASLYVRVRYRVSMIDDLCRHLGNAGCTRTYKGGLKELSV